MNAGLDFRSGKVVFADLDGDGDEDMVRFWTDNLLGSHLEAFENVGKDKGEGYWKSNQALIEGIAGSNIQSLSSGDVNGDGREEVVLGGEGLEGFVKKAGLWTPDTTLFQGFKPGLVPGNPDFADVDSDGDLDMLGCYPTGSNLYYCVLGLWRNTGSVRKPKWEFDSSYFPSGSDRIEGIRFARWTDWDRDGLLDVVYVRWFFDSDWDDIEVLMNRGTVNAAEWEEERVHSSTILEDICVLDWDKNGIDDIVLVDHEQYPEAYLYVPGKIQEDKLTRDFNHPCTWGGLRGSYPGVADVNSDGIPELTLAVQEYHWELNGANINEYFLPHLKSYSFSSVMENLWSRDKEIPFWALGPNEEYPLGGRPVSLQYVDFENNGLIDYVLNLDGRLALYRNRGTKQSPYWQEDTTALEELPSLFPAVFLDVDGDRDKDLIGVPCGDSFPVGFLNVGSDKRPSYGQYDRLVSGLENVPMYALAAGDITDNNLSMPDLAVAVKSGRLTAFFNSGKASPRWDVHEEVFQGLDTRGTPALCDADGDKKLDLFLGGSHYFRNASSGGVHEEKEVIASMPQRICMRRGAELSLEVEGMDEVSIVLYNVAGERVACIKKMPEKGKINRGIEQPAGIYFCRLKQGNFLVNTSVLLLN